MAPSNGLEVADMVRRFGPAFRETNHGKLSRAHLRTLGAIETCRTAALGGHVYECADCKARKIVYNSCRNRHCPKCQSLEKERWLEERCAELLPVPYFHVVFTLPEELNSLAMSHPRLLYNLLFQCASETLLEIAADPKHLGARIGVLAVLHTWGQKLTLHPHLHCIVPGGGLSIDGDWWVGSRPDYFLPVPVLKKLFRGKVLAAIKAAVESGELPCAHLPVLGRLYRKLWVVYCKPPFGSPEQVLAYLARYTHRVAISNQRLLAFDERGVTFRWKDYRAKGRTRHKIMTLAPEEFMRRFLLHVLPAGFHRIRHYGLLANGARTVNLALARALLNDATPNSPHTDTTCAPPCFLCRRCGAPMLIVQTFVPAYMTRAPPHRS